MDVEKKENWHCIYLIIDLYGEYIDEYCEGCQLEGPDQISGFKTHRSLPTDIRRVDIGTLHEDGTFATVLDDGSKDPDNEFNSVLLCGDCLASAQNEGYTVVVKPLDKDMEGNDLPPVPVEEYEEWDRTGIMILRTKMREKPNAKGNN